MIPRRILPSGGKATASVLPPSARGRVSFVIRVGGNHVVAKGRFGAGHNSRARETLAPRTAFASIQRHCARICNSFGSALVQHPAKSACRFLVCFASPFVAAAHGNNHDRRSVGSVQFPVGEFQNVER